MLGLGLKELNGWLEATMMQKCLQNYLVKMLVKKKNYDKIL